MFRLLAIANPINGEFWNRHPPELGPVARQECDRIVVELTQLGLLRSFDRGPLAAYCTAYALWIDAMEMVQKHGAMIKSPNGFPIQSPYLPHLNKQAEIMTRIVSEFGLTPSEPQPYLFRFEKQFHAVEDRGKT